jgi:Uma2 family endonuclease
MSTVTPLRLGPADHGRVLTAQEYLDAEFLEGYRYELARGVLEVTQIPGESHGLIVCYLFERIAFYRQAHPGLIYRWGGGNEYHVWLPEFPSGRHPDVAVTLRAAPRDADGRRRPALAIEVVSPGRKARDRDYLAKREEYLAYGLPEYWIVDPTERRVTVLVREADAWAERRFEDEAAAESVVLPGFRVPLAELWAAAAEADGPDDEPEE